MLRLTLDRPRAIAGVDESGFARSGLQPRGRLAGAPALGLGFALRLVRNLADAVGGALAVERDGLRCLSARVEPPARPRRAATKASA